jgi:hypothetical protein
MAVNANVDFKISGPVDSPSSLNMATKVAYKIGEETQIGFESYNELGELGNLGHLNDQSQTLFAVIDTKIRGWEINFGVGRGLTSVSDRWLVKAVLSVPM